MVGTGAVVLSYDKPLFNNDYFYMILLKAFP